MTFEPVVKTYDNLTFEERTHSESPQHVRSCARCGFNHKDLIWTLFARPIVDFDGVWEWWTTCPVTKDPILSMDPGEKYAGLTLNEIRERKARERASSTAE